MTPHYISRDTLRNILRAHRRGNVGLVALSESSRMRDSVVTSRRWLLGSYQA